jgi:LmbE family N-acetylglucosaminyl deacetylase
MELNELSSLLKCFVLLIFLQVSLITAGDGNKPRKCIMVFGAHADDNEEMAGGTFAKFIDEGYEAVYVGVMNNLSGNRLEKVPGNWNFDTRKATMTLTGSPKTYQVDALETTQTRSEEARNAAKVFGTVPIFLNFAEPEIYLGRKLVLYGTEDYIKYNPPGRKQVALATRYSQDVDIVIELLKKYQPEIVIIHTLGGEKLDHGNSAYLMYSAFKKAIAKGIPVGKLWMNVDGWLLDASVKNSAKGKVDISIDVKNYLKTKYEALDKHVSQNGGMGRIYVKVRGEKQPKEVVEEFITVIDNTK